MIRILHYVGIMNRGGMETFIMNLYRNIDRNIINFDFAVHGEKCGDFEEEILSLGGKFHHFPMMRKNPLKYKQAWRKFWTQSRDEYKAFHFHTNSLANIIALQEAARAGIPVRIVHSHSSYADKGRLQKINNILHKYHKERLGKYANMLFTCSDKAADWLFGGMHTGALKVTELKNGINLSQYKYDSNSREAARENLKLKNCKVVGHIGNFIPVKNHEFIIDILENMIEKDESVRGVLIGKGLLWEKIKNDIQEKNLHDKIYMLGVRSDVSQLLMAMDLFLMPSLYEGFPVSLVEVQASGLSALISDTITHDVQFNDNITFLSLADGAERWAEEALNILGKKERIEDLTSIEKNGFDIKFTVKLYTDAIFKKL